MQIHIERSKAIFSNATTTFVQVSKNVAASETNTAMRMQALTCMVCDEEIAGK